MWSCFYNKNHQFNKKESEIKEKTKSFFLCQKMGTGTGEMVNGEPPQAVRGLRIEKMSVSLNHIIENLYKFL